MIFYYCFIIVEGDFIPTTDIIQFSTIDKLQFGVYCLIYNKIVLKVAVVHSNISFDE